MSNTEDIQKLQQRVEELESKSVITLLGINYMTLKSYDYEKYTHLSEILKIGDKLSYLNEEKAIKIGKGVNHVRIYGQCMICVSQVASLKNVAFFKNNERVSSTGGHFEAFTNDKERMFTLGERIISVKENDLIYLFIRGYAGDKFGANGNGQLFVTVETFD